MTATNMPYCPECGSLLRPHILMFGDWEYMEHTDQYPNFQKFISRVGGIPDVIFLVGSSSEIPTNDYIAQKFQEKGSMVITINPDLSSTRVCKPDIFIQKGALEAFEEIEEIIGSIT